MATKTKSQKNKENKEQEREWRTVAFVDSSSGHVFLIESSVDTKGKTIEIDGVEYPRYELDVSSQTHPFYVKGSGGFVIKNKKVDRFKQRMSATRKESDSK